MRVVLIHRYFWPDTPPYAHILKDIALRLGEEGHDVTVLTCQPSYNRGVVGRTAARERLAARVEIRRWPVLPDRRYAAAKAANLIWFCARLLLARRSLGSADVVMAASTPPIAVAKVGRWLASRLGARFFYHKQDIYPEVVTAPGILRASRWAALLRWLDARTDRAADRVIVLSADMADTTMSRGVARDRVAVINNFDPWEAAEPLPVATREAPRDGLRLVFAGNLGHFQNLETVLAAATELRADSGIEFHVFGDGALKPWLQRVVAEHDLTQVHLHGYRSPGEVATFLRTSADVGIVSLLPGVIRAAYPSKTMSYLRQGCAVLALVEPDSALAQLLASSGAGFHADPTRVEDIANLIRRLAACPADVERAGRRATALYPEQFHPSLQLARWSDLFEHARIGVRG